MPEIEVVGNPESRKVAKELSRQYLDLGLNNESPISEREGSGEYENGK